MITYPAAWGGRRREVLAAAIARAGWPPVDPSTIHTGATPAGGIAPSAGGPGRQATLMVPEPVAAARYFTDVLRRPVPTGRLAGGLRPRWRHAGRRGGPQRGAGRRRAGAIRRDRLGRRRRTRRPRPGRGAGRAPGRRARRHRRRRRGGSSTRRRARPRAEPPAVLGRRPGRDQANVLRDTESNRWSHPPICCGTMLVWLWVRAWIDQPCPSGVYSGWVANLHRSCSKRAICRR